MGQLPQGKVLLTASVCGWPSRRQSQDWQFRLQGLPLPPGCQGVSNHQKKQSLGTALPPVPALPQPLSNWSPDAPAHPKLSLSTGGPEGGSLLGMGEDLGLPGGTLPARGQPLRWVGKSSVLGLTNVASSPAPSILNRSLLSERSFLGLQNGILTSPHCSVGGKMSQGMKVLEMESPGQDLLHNLPSSVQK